MIKSEMLKILENNGFEVFNGKSRRNTFITYKNIEFARIIDSEILFSLKVFIYLPDMAIQSTVRNKTDRFILLKDVSRWRLNKYISQFVLNYKKKVQELREIKLKMDFSN